MPENYSKAINLPLLILLPGYHTDNTYLQESLFNSNSSQEEYIIVTANATKDRLGNYFWNSKAACCNFFQSRVDDKKYLTELTKYLVAEYKVDSERVYLLGHSNGGFMALNMACQPNSPFTGVVSIAGAGNLNMHPCKNNKKTSILLIHGTKDSVISYDGGNIQGITYTSAKQTTQQWLKLKGCNDTPKTNTEDFVDELIGNETTQTLYQCSKLDTVDLWSIDKGSHAPLLNANFTKTILSYFSKKS